MDNLETVRGSDDEPQPDCETLDRWTTACDVLSSRRRYAVVSVLERASGPLSTATLTDSIVSLETDPDGECAEVDAGERATTTDGSVEAHRKSVASSLHHIHLPTLAEAGVIEWDVDRGLVRLRTESATTEYTALIRRAAIL